MSMNVREKEAQAESVARILDDAVSLPGTRSRFGLDPIVGLLPVVGDALVTLAGASILVMGRQLQVPWNVQLRMSYNLLKNGLIGAIPFLGDVYSFMFKCHQLNAALLVRSIKRGEDGHCALTTRPLSTADISALTLLILPTVALILAAGLWFWNHDISLVTLLYPPPYQSHGE
jgi:hypothetical protein